jgi:cytochrome c
MDSFETNKILGALLFTCLVLLTLNITAGAVFSPPKLAKPGYEIAVPEHVAEGAGKDAAPAQDQPIEVLLASADPKRGETAAKKCATCHTFNKGEPNRVGPNLWGVVNRNKAAVPSFNYSAALKGKGGNWSFDDISHFIAAPKVFIPGTNMSFAGVPRANERADIIAYLNAQSDSPAALPKAADASGGGGPAADPAANNPAGGVPKPQ